MAQQISIVFYILVLASVVSARSLDHGDHAMAPSPMPFYSTDISIALPPTAWSPAPRQEPQHLAMAPQVNNILRSPSPAPSHADKVSPAPSHADKVDEGSVFAGIVNSLAPSQASHAKDLIGKALDKLPPMDGPAKDELEKQGAKMAADKILKMESLAPESSNAAMKDALDKVGGLGGATDAITDVISSSGTNVNYLISKAFDKDSPSTTADSTSDDASKTTSTSDLEKMIAEAVASQGGSDQNQESTSRALSMGSSSMAGMIAIVAATACFML